MEKSDIVGQLSSSLGRRDEVPNQQLGQLILEKNDSSAVAILIELLEEGKRAIKKDSIKVLYEVGANKPLMIADYASNFISLLGSKDNRLQWGAMIALGQLAEVNPEPIYNQLDLISRLSDQGSVITRDHAMNVFVKLSKDTKYQQATIPIILNVLEKSPPNQFPKYAEQAATVPEVAQQEWFGKVLELRLEDVPSESGKKRVQKVLKKVKA